MAMFQSIDTFRSKYNFHNFFVQRKNLALSRVNSCCRICISRDIFGVSVIDWGMLGVTSRRMLVAAEPKLVKTLENTRAARTFPVFFCEFVIYKLNKLTYIQ